MGDPEGRARDAHQGSGEAPGRGSQARASGIRLHRPLRSEEAPAPTIEELATPWSASHRRAFPSG